jgi:hypothetical protein
VSPRFRVAAAVHAVAFPAARSNLWVMPSPVSRRLFLTVLLTSACFVRRGTSIEDDSDLVTINVINHHRLNVTIFNVAQGRRDRIGEVTAASNAQFRLHLRRYVSSEIQLYADAVGSPETVRAELLHLTPGDIVEWTLETELNRSHLMVR